MRNLYILSSIFFAALSILTSCDKYTDVHKEYIKDGEVVYAPKPDSVAFVAGQGRIKMRVWMYNAVNVKEIVVRWNGGQDSLAIPATFKNGRDSIDVVLSNLIEKSYTFDVYSTDNFGHKSLLYTQFGTSFGNTYASSLVNRRVKDVVLTDQKGTINWYSAPEGTVFTEIRYTNTGGSATTVRMPAADFSIDVAAKAGSSFDYRSAFIPEAQSIDTFYTKWTTSAIPFPNTYLYSRSTWSVVSVSDETASDGGGKNTLIDGNYSTYWHSSWSPTNAPLPHWAIIDMASPKRVAYVETYRRPGNTDAKTIEVYLGDSADPAAASWQLIGRATYASGDKLTINSTSSSMGRYLKIVVTESNRVPFSSIAEVLVYGN